ncbi:MAG TPA: hypothetical protein VIJ79_18565 [Acidobacteriaceae bacterium]
MLARLKSRWWWPYLALQAIGLFHLFYPLPSHYRHHFGRLAILALVPGGPTAVILDWMIHGRKIIGTAIGDEVFISVITMLINCTLFALLIVVVRWAVRVRKNSWRTRVNSID